MKISTKNMFWNLFFWFCIYFPSIHTTSFSSLILLMSSPDFRICEKISWIFEKFHNSLSNFFVFQYFLIKISVWSDLILIRSFPGSFENMMALGYPPKLTLEIWYWKSVIIWKLPKMSKIPKFSYHCIKPIRRWVPKVIRFSKLPGNERIRTRSACSLIFIKKYWKTKKLEREFEIFQKSNFFF